MRVNAHLFVVIVVPRAPLSLKIEHVELCIFGLVQVQQLDRDLVFGVGKGTQLAVDAIHHVIWVGLAKFTFVFFWMIKFLDPVVSLVAGLALRAREICVKALDLVAHLAGVASERPAPVLLGIVVVEALFGIVVWQIFRLVFLYIRAR